METMETTATQSLSMTCTPELPGLPPQDNVPSFIVMSSITAPEFRPEKRAPVDMICVIDRSGSMAGDRLTMAKDTVDFVVENLQKEDRLGIVTYDDLVSNHFPLTFMTALGKESAKKSIKSIVPGGSTNLCGALVEGVNQMRRREGEKNEVASVLLFTDGQANIGFVSAEDIIRATIDSDFANKAQKEERRLLSPWPFQLQNWQATPSVSNVSPAQVPVMLSPVAQGQNPSDFSGALPAPSDEPKKATRCEPLPCTIHTFGYGSAHDATLLKKIADHGQGTYYYIDSTQAISASYADCLGGLLSVVAQNIKVTFEAQGRGVKINRIMTKSNCTEVVPGLVFELSLGDIQSEEQKDILCDLSISASAASDQPTVVLRVTVSYSNVITGTSHSITQEATISRLSAASMTRNVLVDKQKNRIHAAEAMDAANELARGGDMEAARNILRSTRDRIKESPSRDDPFCQGLVADLDRCQEGLISSLTYADSGSKILSNQMQAHFDQRTTNASPMWSAQSAYTTSPKKEMQSIFSSKFS